MRVIMLAVIMLLLGACGQDQGASTLTFTALADPGRNQQQEHFERLAAYLEKELRIKVRYQPVTSYPAAVDAFRDGKVQMAWFDGLSGVRARNQVPGAQAIAQGKEDAGAKSYFIANTATGLSRSDKLPDAFLQQGSFTFGDQVSTSGRLMPEYYFRQRFHDSPQALMPKVGFSDHHHRTLARVQSGTYATGVLSHKVWARAMQAGDIDTNKVIIVWETPIYPDYHWSVQGDLDKHYGQGFTDKLTRALLALDDPEILAAFRRQAFIPASNPDYRPIQQAAEQAGLLD